MVVVSDFSIVTVCYVRENIRICILVRNGSRKVRVGERFRQGDRGQLEMGFTLCNKVVSVMCCNKVEFYRSRWLLEE